ncbi:unnamed protein product [Staurois parvus]|uniref:Uncharacterized protein n=1 Tax=Staurois parvus TaxID=386267 RepID=A0ABN9FZD0_9NEOB|nr:unnamed protein product [Staurois parvus]
MSCQSTPAPPVLCSPDSPCTERRQKFIVITSQGGGCIEGS